MIHGVAADFGDDTSDKLILAHTARRLTEDERAIGSGAPFGTIDVLIEGTPDVAPPRVPNTARSISQRATGQLFTAAQKILWSLNITTKTLPGRGIFIAGPLVKVTIFKRKLIFGISFSFLLFARPLLMELLSITLF